MHQRNVGKQKANTKNQTSFLIMKDQRIRDFIEVYSRKEKKIKTVSDFHNNHEIWRKCSCGNEEDIRMSYNCTVCGAILYKPKKNNL